MDGGEVSSSALSGAQGVVREKTHLVAGECDPQLEAFHAGFVHVQATARVPRPTRGAEELHATFVQLTARAHRLFVPTPPLQQHSHRADARVRVPPKTVEAGPCGHLEQVQEDEGLYPFADVPWGD